MKKLSVLLLMLGLLFSVFYIRASWGVNGSTVEYQPNRLSNLFMLGGGSEHMYVTTSFIGYLFLVVFGLINLNRSRTMGLSKPLSLFLTINIILLLFELSSWLLMYQNAFHGIHARIGALLVLPGLLLWDRMYHNSK